MFGIFIKLLPVIIRKGLSLLRNEDYHLKITKSSILNKSRSLEFLIKTECLEDFSWKGTIEHLPSNQVQEYRNFQELVFLILGKLEELEPQLKKEMHTWKE